MTDPRDQPTEPVSSDADSFDAFLKKAAHVSGPKVSSLGPLLSAGGTLLEGRLKIQRHIGEGGMGVVYAAFDEQRRGTVALKTLNRLDAASVYRLKNEFRSLADVSHPNLCHLHELFGDRGHWFFTMELVDGERFDQYVRHEGTLSEPRLRAVLPQLIDGIEAIHNAGKLHRDLKPSNVLVTRDGRVVILDFGLAMDTEAGGVGHTVRDTSVSGTPGYMAPEQAAGQPATAASDYYAVGAMLFEALTGKLPFEGRVHEMLVDKQRTDAPSASSISQDIPTDLDALCAQLLSRDPTTRPSAQSIRERLGVTATTKTCSHRPLTLSDAPQPTVELLGRDEELQALRDAYAQSLAAKSTIVWVSGESGMGKSALCEVFLNELRALGQATVLAGRCYERENVPFKAFDAVVDELSRYLRRLPAQDAAALLPREAYALARIFPVLDRVRVVADAPRKDVPDPNDLMRRAFEAFGELMARMRDRAPLVVFIDDLQWMDQDSVRFMRALFVQPDPVPALLVCAHRSERAEDNALLQAVKQAADDNSAIDVRTLNVGPLSTAAMQLLAQRLVPKGNDASVAATFATESRGNPFFAKELARAATLHGALPSLGDALALHIGSLPPDAQRLLSVLALAGQPLSALIAVEASGATQGFDHLDALRAEQLVRLSIKGNDRFVECYHDKIREQLVSTMDTLLTRELAAALSRVLLAQSNLDHELLARCLELAGEDQRAAEHALRAADVALASLAFRRAAELYADALRLGEFSAEVVQTVRVSRANALARGGRGVAAAEAYLVARDHASRDQHALLSRLAAEQYLMCGRIVEGRTLLADALRPIGLRYPQTLVAAIGAIAYEHARLSVRGLKPAASRSTNPHLWQQLEALGPVATATLRTDHARAPAFCARWLRCALDSGDPAAVARALGWEIFVAAIVGRSKELSAARVAWAERLCAETNDPEARINLCFGRGWVRIFAGDYVGALKDFDQSVQLYAEHPDVPNARYDRPWVDYHRTLPLAYLGRWREIEQSVPSALEDGWARNDLTILPNLAGSFNGLARAAVGHGQDAERDHARVAAVWNPPEVMQQDAQLAISDFFLRLYAGDARGVYDQVTTFRRRLDSSALGRLGYSRIFRAWHGQFAVAFAATLTPGLERSALLDEAARYLKDARSIDGDARVEASALAPTLQAALACQRGRPEEAITVLRDDLRERQRAPIYTMAMRRRLGVMIGGDEGGALVREADAFFSAGGAIDPERVVAVLAPGIEQI